jgi:hypothetical protein
MLAAVAGACGAVNSQDFALQVADSNPLGIGNFVPTRLQLLEDAEGITGGIKGVFMAAVDFEAIYDSNFFLADGNEDSEIILNLTPSLSYSTDPEGGAIWTFMANYRPALRVFVDNSDLNDIDQAADMVLAFNGARTQASLYTRYNEFSATDRFTGNFNTGRIFTTGIMASRLIAPRTTLNGGMSYAISDYDSSIDEGSDVFSTYFGALWSATERTSLGGTLRYTRTESDNTGSRDAWALLAEVRYRLGERIWLSASIGPEFYTDSQNNEDGVSLRGDIQARYVINDRWSWVNAFRTANIPSPSDAGYIVNNYSFRSSLEHQLLRATVTGGIEFNYTEFEAVGNTLVDRGDEENLSLFLSYYRNVFSDRVSLYSTVRYNTNNGAQDWSQWLVSLGVNVPF